MTDTAPMTRSTVQREAARIAGVVTLAMAAAGMFASLSVATLSGDGAAGTIVRINDAGPLLSLAIVAFLLVVVLDVVLAWALWRFFGRGHRDLPVLAAWLRVAYAGVLATAVGNLATARFLADGGANDAATHAALEQFSATWQLGLVVFAAHLVVLGWIVIDDDATPTWIGVVLLVAGFAYASDGVSRLFVSDGTGAVTVALTLVVTCSSVVGEIGLGLWLLMRGGKSANA